MAKPFSDRVCLLNLRGITFKELSKRSNWVRSAPWWCSVANGQYVRPPKRDELGRIAKALGLSQHRALLMIIEEWYGVDISTCALDLKRHADTLHELSRHLDEGGSTGRATS